MTFDEFITKWTGKPIDYDGIYPNQCMDLMHFYKEEVLGFTDKALLAAPTASQTYETFSSHPTWVKYFQKTDNTLWNLPQKGDILFFGTKVGPSGHVCIVYSANLLNFKSFDANWPIGSLPHLQDHNYIGCLGWVRLIPESVIPTHDTNYYQSIIKNAYERVTLVQQEIVEILKQLKG